MVESEGRMVTLSRKAHAECAGIGFEYCLDRAKYSFRSITGTPSKVFWRNSVSLGRINIPLHLNRKYARKCHDCMRAYRQGAAKDGANDKKHVSATTVL